MTRFYLCIKGGDVVEPVDGLAAGDEVDAVIGDLPQVHIGTDSEAGGIFDIIRKVLNNCPDPAANNISLENNLQALLLLVLQ